MAGICITDIVCDLLNFAVTAHKQQFFCLGDPVTGQIFIDRAPKIAHKQARQILGGYIDVAAELFGGQILHVVFLSAEARAGRIFPTQDRWCWRGKIHWKTAATVHNSHRRAGGDCSVRFQNVSQLYQSDL